MTIATTPPPLSRKQQTTIQQMSDRIAQGSHIKLKALEYLLHEKVKRNTENFIISCTFLSSHQMKYSFLQYTAVVCCVSSYFILFLTFSISFRFVLTISHTQHIQSQIKTRYPIETHTYTYLLKQVLYSKHSSKQTHTHTVIK